MNTMSDSILRALGWVLVHALWQGTVLALLLLILLPRLQTARQRYWLAYGALTSILVAAIGTFCWTFKLPTESLDVNATGINSTLESGTFSFGNPFFETSFSETIFQWLETNHTLIVAIWLLGFVFFLLRLAGGLWQIRRLRTSGLRTLAPDWEAKLQSLAMRMGVTQTVQLFESIWIHTPLTIGWLKPVILLPIGFVNHLSQAEVEAVLAHELAHIARRDWVFNLLQAFVETLFYYHPAVWWISQIIHRERENACDDAALNATGNPIAFARALVQVQEMAKLVPTLALAMRGKRRSPLLARVRRILNQAPQQQHQVMEKITATVILLALLALVGFRANSSPSLEAAFAQISAFPNALFSNEAGEDQMVSDSLPKGTRKITREDENGQVEAEYKNGKIARLNIDGKEIPAAEFGAHAALIEELQADIPAPPAPPAPPRLFWGTPGTPASPDFPEAPEAPEPPEAPEGFRFPTPPPFPGMAPLPPLHGMGGVSMVTDKDKDGNTVISIDGPGSSTSVVVKNGEVWVDGRKIAQGEALSLMGNNFGQDGQNFYFNNSDGFGQSFGDGSFAWSGVDPISPAQQEKMAQEMKQLSEAHARQMEEHQRNFKRDQKRAEKDWKKNQKDWEKQQKNWKKDQKNWEVEQKVWQDKQQKWQAEHRAMEAKSQATQDLIKAELLRDGLITNPDNFSMRLDAKTLEINNKKQPEALHKKYKELFEGASGNTMKDGASYLYNYSED